MFIPTKEKLLKTKFFMRICMVDAQNEVYDDNVGIVQGSPSRNISQIKYWTFVVRLA